MAEKLDSIRVRPGLAGGPRLPDMDPLAGLLSGPRARQAFLLRVLLDPPWSMRVQDQAPLTLVVMVRGDGWVLPERGEPRPLRAGDVALFRGPEPYVVADHPDTPPQVVIHPGQLCTTPAGETLTAVPRRHRQGAGRPGRTMDLGVRSWGTNPQGQVAMLVGTYPEVGAVGALLLDALPALVVLPGAAWDSPLVPLLGAEVQREDPGQEVVLDRLLDLLVVMSLRTWFARPDTATPPWYAAQDDPVVGRALRLLQNAPARPWTVARLAAECGVSRAALARRFTELVGEPPMAFLAGWRLALAADLLTEPGATVASVATRVGYASPFALSTAFKRVRGVSPREHQRRAAAEQSATVRAAIGG
ncbi:AraC-type DNA-binding protein [Actinopolymorpha singaporensis]|uniref:AraC-type DNA-binding protein n=2 Tax=Actinopolymorpha singaporensis TaxID=117157 RepID=A0A1H1TF50_9ACTN|nr:AraC-type DNA-binding protein [Actinopolymorpha singaporensis]